MTRTLNHFRFAFPYLHAFAAKQSAETLYNGRTMILFASCLTEHPVEDNSVMALRTTYNANANVSICCGVTFFDFYAAHFNKISANYCCLKAEQLTIPN